MDSNLIVWNAQRNAKLNVLAVPQPYTMSVRFDPNSESLAFGGLDCAVYWIQNAFGSGAQARPTPLLQHDGYVSSVSFLDSGRLVSGSADRTVRVYDVQRPGAAEVLGEHFRDVMSVDCLGRSLVASGACDGFCRVFDVRVPPQGPDSEGKRTARPVQMFSALHADANSVKFSPSGQQVLVGTSANRLLLYDLRSEHVLFKYEPEVSRAFLAADAQEIRQVAFSRSGRLLFAAGENNVYMFDSLFESYLGLAGQHETQVTCVEVQPAGECVVSGSWDSLLKVWA